MRLLISTCILALAFGCGDDSSPSDGGSRDTGGRDVGGSDTGGRDTGASDGGDDDGGGCVPTIEICGDRIDQNCDGRDTSCGDSDMDGIMACREGDDLTMCDCDDSRADVRPPFGPGVPGAPELCDGLDNDCNGRIDESAMCCAGCASLDDTERADVCLEGSGACDCSTEPGEGPCPTGQKCCAVGCVDTQTDFDNCGFCGSMCTVSADRCVGGMCMCGSGPVCDLDRACTGGSC